MNKEVNMRKEVKGKQKEVKVRVKK